MSLTRRLAAYSGARCRRLQPLMDTDEVATLQAHPCEVVEPNCFLAVEMRAKDVSHMTVACQGREKADCRDHRCSHHVEISADRWPDDVRLSDIEPGFVCTACGWVNSECGRCNVSFAPKPTELERRHELSPSADRRHGSISSPPNNQPYERDARSCSITEQLNSDTQTVAARALARPSLERSRQKIDRR